MRCATVARVFLQFARERTGIAADTWKINVRALRRGSRGCLSIHAENGYTYVMYLYHNGYSTSDIVSGLALSLISEVHLQNKKMMVSSKQQCVWGGGGGGGASAPITETACVVR